MLLHELIYEIEDKKFNDMMSKIISGTQPSLKSKVMSIPKKLSNITTKRYYIGQSKKYATLSNTALHDSLQCNHSDPLKTQYEQQFFKYRKFHKYFEMMIGNIEYDSVFVKVMRNDHPWLKRISPIQE